MIHTEKKVHELPRILSPITRQSVLRVKRQPTNKIFGIIFTISLLLWIVAVIIAVFLPVKKISMNIYYFDELNNIRILFAIDYVLLFSVFTIIIFMILKWILHVTNIVLWTFWIGAAVYVSFAMYQTTFLSMYTVIGIFFSYIFLIILMNKEWFHLSKKVLKEACKMMISVPSTSVFALFVGLLNAFLIGIIVAVTEKLISSDQSLLPILLLVVNVVFGIWTVVVVAALSIMTMSGVFAEYYWAEDKTKISVGTVLRLFAINCRYHIGTAAMFHPLLGGSIALYYQKALVVPTIAEGASIREISFFIYNVLDTVVLRIAMLGAAAGCGMKGENFQKSMARALTLLNDASRTFTVVKVMESLLELSTLSITVLSAFSTLGYLDHILPGGSKNSWHWLFSILSILGGMLITVTFLTSITVACYSIMLCLQEELDHFGSRAPQEACATSPDLHFALNDVGPPNWFHDFCDRCLPDIEIEIA